MEPAGQVFPGGRGVAHVAVAEAAARAGRGPRLVVHEAGVHGPGSNREGPVAMVCFSNF